MSPVRHLAVVTAGTGAPSASELLSGRLGRATVDAAAEPLEVREVKVRALASDLVNATLTRLPSPALSEAIRTIGTSAGVIAVTPIYNGSYSGLFKLFVDALDEGVLRGRPVLMAATGGTARHSLAIDQAMLPLFYYLRAVPSPTSVYAATDDWGDDARLAERIGAAGRDFAALIAERPATDHTDEFDQVPDFADLLRGSVAP